MTIKLKSHEIASNGFLKFKMPLNRDFSLMKETAMF